MNNEEINNKSNNESSEDIKVGVYICHCGGNISDVVDVEKVKQEIAKMSGVDVSNNYIFMCSDPGQNMIIEDIKAKNINRVIVAACNPALHELTFRKALQRANLNPYLYEHVNIREQDSWVHKSNPVDATNKAIRLVAAGVNKMKLQSPLKAIQVNSTAHVLVIGAGIAGLKSAITLAKRGLNVTVVEKTGYLGGRTAELGKVYPTEEHTKDILKDIVDEVLNNELITIYTNSEIKNVKGFIGNFDIEINDNSNKDSITNDTTGFIPNKGFYYKNDNIDAKIKLKVGSIVIATGFKDYKPYKGEYGFEESSNVISLSEFIKHLNRQLENANNSKKHFIFNDKVIKNVAFIHCVGSRQVQGVDKPADDGQLNQYCSRICCTSVLHNINILKDNFKDINVFDFYKDIRTYGRFHEEYYENASKKGVIFFKFPDEEPPKVKVNGNSKNPISVISKDILTWGEEIEVQPDLVVLAAGIEPNNISDLIEMMKLPTGVDRFLSEVHPKLRPIELANDGIFLAGTSQGPMDINEACSAAEAAAVKASILLTKDSIELDPYVAEVDKSICDGTGLCVHECSYEGAIYMIEKEINGKLVNIAEVNKALCKGCGACVAVCPNRAINVAGWTLDQFDSMIDAFVAEKIG